VRYSFAKASGSTDAYSKIESINGRRPPIRRPPTDYLLPREESASRFEFLNGSIDVALVEQPRCRYSDQAVKLAMTS
jgi:hypothetical protein